jgi:hypothetical protein
MASSINLPTIPGPPLKSHFLGGNHLVHHKPSFIIHKHPSTQQLKTCAKFDPTQDHGRQRTLQWRKRSTTGAKKNQLLISSKKNKKWLKKLIDAFYQTCDMH